MRILVTGGAGFIGSHFVLRHVEQFPRDQIIVLDVLTHAGDIGFLNPVRDRITFIHGNITDAPLIDRILREERIETIVNFAAESHVGSSIKNSIPHVQTNVLGVYTIIEACRKVPHILLMHISTDEVYGSRPKDEAPSTPNSPLRPGNPYAATKAAGDLALFAAMNTYGLRVRISRCTNNFGPHQADEKFMSLIIKNALQDKSIPLHGDGEHLRDWIYVTDNTDALECIIDKGKDGTVYHISSNAEKRNIDVARSVLDELGKPHSLITFVEDRPGNDRRYDIDSSNTRELGWKPAVNFLDGLRNTIKWYRRNGTAH
jgi:dTDP-glucose 4,6-dehydratase